MYLRIPAKQIIEVKVSNPLNYEKIGKTIENIDEEIPFAIPRDWEWCRLKTICKKLLMVPIIP